MRNPIRQLPFLFILIQQLLWSQDRVYEEQKAHDFVPPPSPALCPEEALKTFQLEEGFAIELVASEPLIEDPVAMTWDAKGNLYVVELRSYMQDIQGSRGSERINRVKFLQDTDGDGKMDVAKVFLDKLDRPRAISAVNGGVLVAEHEKLWFAKDTDGDGVADVKELVDPKYATSGSVEHRDNGLVRNLDNWHYNAMSYQRYRFRDGKWERGKIHKRGQWGISQDDLGRLYYGYNWSQLHADRFPAGYLPRAPGFKPALAVNAHLTLDQSVKPIRMGTGVNRGYRPGILDGRGYLKEFASSCAPHVYRGQQFPKEFYGNAFVCGAAANLVKRNVIVEDGLEIESKSTGLDHEFLASTDERFRPVALQDGPDGALYVVDYYRGVIQLAPFMTTYLRNESLSRGLDKPIHLGRIYRITYKGNTPVDKVEVTADSNLLSHPNGWTRDTAQRLLIESQDAAHFPKLLQILEHSPDPLARIHALWTLEGLRYPHPEKLVKWLQDEDSEVQVHAIRVLESLMEDQPVILRERILNLPFQSEKAALQAILTLGLLKPEEIYSQLAKLVAPRLENPLFREALLCSMAVNPEGFLKATQQSEEWRNPSLGQKLFLETLQLYGNSPTSEITSDTTHLSRDEQALYNEGQQLYSSFCAGCHGADGAGMHKLGPPLQHSEWVTGSYEITARILYKGMEGPVTVNGKKYAPLEILPAMPPLFSLKDSQLVSILAYIRNSWGHKASIPSKKDLRQIRDLTIGRATPWKDEELRDLFRQDEKDSQD